MFLYNHRTAEKVVLPSPTYSGENFSLTFNTMQATEQYPLTIGMWELYYEVEEDVPPLFDQAAEDERVAQRASNMSGTGSTPEPETGPGPEPGSRLDGAGDSKLEPEPWYEGPAPVPVRMGPGLSVRAMHYPGLFSTARYSYWVMPAAEPGSDQFCLAINYRTILWHTDPDVPHRPRHPMKRALRVLRNVAYVFLYNVFVARVAPIRSTNLRRSSTNSG